MAELERTHPDTPSAKFRISEKVVAIAQGHLNRLSAIVSPTSEEAQQMDLWRSIIARKGQELAPSEVDLILKS